MFTIQKDLNGIFWHIYNNARSIVNVSDFDVVIDDVSNTFIIQCKNGSNIPNQAISISLIQVIDLSVGTSPILFSGANGLIQLLTAKGYTPYLQVPPSVSVVVYRVGQVGVFTMTPTQFTDNFTETGLGTNTMLGWALRNGNNGTKNQQGKFSLNKGVSPYDVIGTLGGSANSVLIGHDHESAVFSNGRKGVNDTGTGGTFNGNVLVEAEANQKIVKTSIKGQSNTGADVPSEDGVGKNMPPYLIDVWVERVTELVINSGSGGGGVQSVTGTTVDNTDPLNPVVETPSLTQVLTAGDILPYTIPIPNNTFVTFDLGRELTENYFTTDDVGTGGVFLDKDVVFPDNATIRFQAGYVEDNVTPTNVTLLPYRFTTDAYVFYQGARVTDITLRPEDVCMLKLDGENSTDSIQIWFLTVVSNSSGGSVTPSTLISTDADNALTVGTDSKLFVAESTGTLPYQELIFTAVQTAPQTGITSGTLIEGGRYTIADADITADFVISGAADNEIGTVFIANATPPDWGDFGTLDFEGNPIVTILNNPLSDTYSSHYTAAGVYYLEGLLDFPVDTFPKLGADGYVDNVIRSLSDGTGLLSKSYLWHKDNFNDKRILIKTMTGGTSSNLEDDQLNGTQLFIVKIFNP